eukprot:2468841-Rhodomonas_salina.1
MFEVVAGVLAPGGMYESTLRDLVAPGRASYQVSVNPAPSGGACQVTPSTGFALETLFTVECNGFDDSDGGVTYQFGYDGVLFKPQKSPTISLYLPAGLGMSLSIVVEDARGASAPFSTSTVDVMGSRFDASQEKQQAEQLLSRAAQIGDVLLLEHLIAAIANSAVLNTDQATVSLMAEALDSILERTTMTAEVSKTVLQSIRLLVGDGSYLDKTSLESVGRSLLKIASFDALGMSQLTPSHVQEAVSVSTALLASALSTVDLVDPNALGEALVKLGETSLKSLLATQSYYLAEPSSSISAMAKRLNLGDLNGVTVVLPADPVSVSFPTTFSSASGFQGAAREEPVDLQLFFSKDVAVKDNNKIVSGSISVTVSLSSESEPAVLEDLPGEIFLNIPVNTNGVLTEEETEFFFFGGNARCVYWVGAAGAVDAVSYTHLTLPTICSV